MKTAEKTLLIIGLAGFVFLIWHRAQQAQAVLTSDENLIFSAPATAVGMAMQQGGWA